MCVLPVRVRIVKDGQIDAQPDVNPLQSTGMALQFDVLRSRGFRANS